MMLVKLSSEVSVNPDLVASVVINSEYDSVTVMMHDGAKYHYGPDYSRSIWQTADRINAAINGDENGND